MLTQNSQDIIAKYAKEPKVAVQQEEVTKKVDEALAKNVHEGAINGSKLIYGPNLNRSTASNAINSRPCKTVKWVLLIVDIK